MPKKNYMQAILVYLSDFGGAHAWNVRCSLKSQKITKNTLFFDFFDVGTPGKVVSSACYDKQQVCVYLQPFSC